MPNIADYLINRAKQTPYFHLEGYMERFWLVTYASEKAGPGCGKVSWFKNPLIRFLQTFDIAIRVHHILRSDNAREHHDHPWAYLTVILKGGYTEVTLDYDKSGLFLGERRRFYGPGSILWRPAKSWHRLEVNTAGEGCWTLFITGKYQQKWGFLKTPFMKIPHNEYKNKNNYTEDD